MAKFKIHNRLIQFISNILSPFFLFGPIQLAIFYLTSNLDHKVLLVSNIILQSVIPILLIILFIKLKINRDIEITNREERTLYFIIVSILFSNFMAHN